MSSMAAFKGGACSLLAFCHIVRKGRCFLEKGAWMKNTFMKGQWWETCRTAEERPFNLQ